VPGDLASRQQFLFTQLQQRGLSTFDIPAEDQTSLYAKLTIPSGWQGNVTRYLDVLAEKKRNGQLQRANVLSSNDDGDESVVSDVAKKTSQAINKIEKESGFSIPVIILLVGVFLFAKK